MQSLARTVASAAAGQPKEVRVKALRSLANLAYGAAENREPLWLHAGARAMLVE